MSDFFDFSQMTRGSYGHNDVVGIKFVAVGDDWVEVMMDYDPQLVMDPETNVLASGAIISLIDTACGMSIIAKERCARPNATLDLRVDYMRPARVGNRVTARGTCYKITRSVAFVRCEAHDGDPDDIIAHASGSFIFTGVK